MVPNRNAYSTDRGQRSMRCRAPRVECMDDSPALERDGIRPVQQPVHDGVEDGGLDKPLVPGAGGQLAGIALTHCARGTARVPAGAVGATLEPRNDKAPWNGALYNSRGPCGTSWYQLLAESESYLSIVWVRPAANLSRRTPHLPPKQSGIVLFQWATRQEGR